MRTQMLPKKDTGSSSREWKHCKWMVIECFVLTESFYSCDGLASAENRVSIFSRHLLWCFSPWFRECVLGPLILSRSSSWQTTNLSRVSRLILMSLLSRIVVAISDASSIHHDECLENLHRAALCGLSLRLVCDAFTNITVGELDCRDTENMWYIMSLEDRYVHVEYYQAYSRR